MYAAFHYGPQSRQYAIGYWITDYVLVLAVFLLIASFFRRVCAKRPEVWRRIWLTLVAVLIMTGAVSFGIVAARGHSFFPYFVIEFQQDLYFACLVLTTVLYLMVVKFDHGDDQLGLLVTGLGMMFAGSAASYALFIAGGRGPLYGILTGYIPQISDIAMLAVWFYAAARMPKYVREWQAERPAREDLRTGALARTMLRP